ncbi:bifunctional hydroxymethylpyrimidine kinase/phosphomethylpyrimidine kinase [Granulicella aggregans]|uniref:bifunctional hydroxymethylpyrimidine kinase/phosphomethylpyrimidine kinase n=1 Tax=Granulicella aggregans TaxID=474949 RepID=UPI00161013B9|nr:bifunctional hydroxymethylpyrimidine kinase/phosphomethylpyrimidine kinase [Granulicella aggregans]
MPSSVTNTIGEVKTVLTIAGFDPSSGAGVTADLMVFAAHGLFGTSCITALTVQSTMGVRAFYPVEASILSDSLACLDDDLPPAGIKIGMMGTRAAVATVCDYLERLRRRGSDIPVVLDPVIRSSSGRELLEPEGVDLLKKRLLPLVDWVTPNHSELGWLTGRSDIKSKEETVRAAEDLQREVIGHGGKPLNVLATGGDIIPPDDLLVTLASRHHWMSGEHVETSSTHGTGCALSSALLCRLVLGDDLITATRNAKSYVAEALRSAVPIGRGRGPMNHLWPIR